MDDYKEAKGRRQNLTQTHAKEQGYILLILLERYTNLRDQDHTLSKA